MRPRLAARGGIGGGRRGIARSASPPAAPPIQLFRRALPPLPPASTARTREAEAKGAGRVGGGGGRGGAGLELGAEGVAQDRHQHCQRGPAQHARYKAQPRPQPVLYRPKDGQAGAAHDGGEAGVRDRLGQGPGREPGPL